MKEKLQYLLYRAAEIGNKEDGNAQFRGKFEHLVFSTNEHIAKVKQAIGQMLFAYCQSLHQFSNRSI